MLKQITEWNTVKKIWMIGEADLFSQQYKPYSARWPISGMMRNGVVYELPMLVHHTTGLESSSSPIQVLGTPTTATSDRSAEFRKGSNPNPVEFVEDLIAGGLLPTPNTMEHREIKTPEQIAELKELSPGGYRNLREVVINELPDSSLFMTPTAVEREGGSVGERKKIALGHYVMLRDQVKDLAEDNLLRTPSVIDSTGGAISESQARERGRMVKVADQVAEIAFENNLKVSDSITASLLPTPAVGHIRNHDEPIENYLQRRQDFVEGRTKGMPGASLGVAVRMEMLPTPVTTDGKPVDVANQVLTRNSLTLQSITAILDMPKDTWEKTDLSHNKARQVGESARRRMEMLPTVTVQDGKNTAGKSQFERNTLPLNAEVTLIPETNWGKFEPAIRRWESLTRVAPSPTKPDGKDGNHRLSAEFTEWMMGLPEGWVTAEDIGLKRNDQLKACGNGVVPQQAELALRILLDGLNFESTIRGGVV